MRFRVTLVLITNLILMLNYSLCQQQGSSRYRNRLRKNTTTTVSQNTESLTISTPIHKKISLNILENVTTTELPKLNNTTTETSMLNTTTRKPEINISYEDCGKRIDEDHPWLAIIEHIEEGVHNRGRVRRTLSKGVLIHPQFVLTTISSLRNSHPYYVVKSVRLGDPISYVTLDAEEVKMRNIKTVRIPVDEAFLHPRKDFAILRLSKKVIVSDSIRPICLPTTSTYNFRELYLHRCRYNGGRYEDKKYVRTLPASPLTPQDCTILFTRKKSKITNTEFCAWDEQGDECAGDIGGPLFVKIDDAYTVIGLHSVMLVDYEVDDDTLPGIYANVGSHLNWISSVLNNFT